MDRIIPLLFVVWLGIAIAAGASGAVARLRPPMPQVVLLGLFAAQVAAYAAWPRFRAFARSIPLRALVAFHLVRFVGFYFLYLHDRGRLPGEFAVKAGWGDIAIATGAVWLLLSRATEPPPRRLSLLAWNVLGLIDIVFVIVTATRLALADPPSMGELLRLPLSLLPTLIVPLILATHLLMIARLWSRDRTQQRGPNFVERD